MYAATSRSDVQRRHAARFAGRTRVCIRGPTKPPTIVIFASAQANEPTCSNATRGEDNAGGRENDIVRKGSGASWCFSAFFVVQMTLPFLTPHALKNTNCIRYGGLWGRVCRP